MSPTLGLLKSTSKTLEEFVIPHMSKLLSELSLPLPVSGANAYGARVSHRACALRTCDAVRKGSKTRSSKCDSQLRGVAGDTFVASGALIPSCGHITVSSSSEVRTLIEGLSCLRCRLHSLSLTALMVRKSCTPRQEVGMRRLLRFMRWLLLLFTDSVTDRECIQVDRCVLGAAG